MQRKVYRLPKAGNIANLKVSEEELESPKADEVQVEVKAIGLNFADIFAILGLYSATPEGSFIPGLEFSGIITKVGDDVTDKQVGDCIMGVTRFGAYASHLNIDNRYVQHLPENWTFEHGASYLVQALTAYYGLFHLGDLKPYQTVLIHSAAGGVGIWANRMAKKFNAYTIGSVGDPDKLDLLRQENYDGTIVRDLNFKGQLEASLRGRELNLIMECIGGKIMKEGYEMLAPMGRMVIYGSARYGSRDDSPNWLRLIWLYLSRPKIDPQKMIELNRGILGFNLIWLYHQTDLMLEIIEKMKQMDLGFPYVGHTYDFENLREAIRYFQSGATTGKVVIKI